MFVLKEIVSVTALKRVLEQITFQYHYKTKHSTFNYFPSVSYTSTPAILYRFKAGFALAIDIVTCKVPGSSKLSHSVSV